MTPRNSPLPDWVALNLLPGLTPLRKFRALERWGTPGRVAHDIPADRLSAAGAERIRTARRGLAAAVERELDLARRLGAEPVPLGDPRYPADLLELPDPPVLLYVRGCLRQPRVRVALVGSRHPTFYGRRVAAGTAESLAGRGIVVVSGGARGVDTAAHEGALAGGGATIVILGSGLAAPYPPDNRSLFERVAGGGALVSEFPLRAGPLRYHFPRRNRLIAGLAAAVVVVEAAARSGSLITAAHALDQGREVLAVPGPVTSPQSWGTNRLIRDGAAPLLDTADLVDALPPLYRAALAGQPANEANSTKKARNEGVSLTSDERLALALLDPVEPHPIDTLAERWPHGLPRLQAALLGLALKGRVEETPGRYYVARPPRA